MRALEAYITSIAKGHGPSATEWNQRLWAILATGDYRYVNNYRALKYPEHPDADKDGNVYEHRLIAMINAGRLLEPDEELHHRNEIRHDNWPHNLVICRDSKEHQRRHRMSNRRLKANRKGATDGA